MAKNRNLNISSWIIVMGYIVVSYVVGITDYSICCGGFAQEPVLKEETHHFHQASLPFWSL